MPPPPPKANRRTKSDNDHDLTSTLLPIQLLQRILTLMPTIDAVRVSTLSRTWLHAWTTLPVFTFNFSCHTQEFEDTFNLITKFNTTISILNDKEATSVNFHISWPSFRNDLFENCIDDWMRLVSRNHVRKIEIDLLNPQEKIGEEEKEKTETYNLPHETLFSAAQSLVVLKLRECRMKLQSLLIENRNLGSLRVLYWESYSIDRKLVRRLLLLCPVLEECTLISVSKGVSSILLFDHRKLKHLKLDGFVTVTMKLMPNLQVLDVSNFEVIETGNKCKKIRKVSLKTCKETNYGYLQCFISFLPLLESLVLNTYGTRPITVSNHIVENIIFSSCTSAGPPQNIKVHAPRLRCYEYRGSLLPEISFEMNPLALKKIHLALMPPRDETLSFFNSLMINLPKLAAYSSVLKLTISAKEFLPDELLRKDGHSSAFINSVELQDIPSPLIYSTSLIKWLFWCSRPLRLSTHPSYMFLQAFRNIIDDATKHCGACSCLRGVKVETQCGIVDFKEIKIDENCELLSEGTLKFQLEWL